MCLVSLTIVAVVALWLREVTRTPQRPWKSPYRRDAEILERYADALAKSKENHP